MLPRTLQSFIDPVHGLLRTHSSSQLLSTSQRSHTLTFPQEEMRTLRCLLSSGCLHLLLRGSPTPVRAPSLCPSFEGTGWHTLARFLWEGGQAPTWLWGPLCGRSRCSSGSSVQKFPLLYGVTPRAEVPPPDVEEETEAKER